MGLPTRWPTRLFNYAALLWGILALAGCYQDASPRKALPVPPSRESRVMGAAQPGSRRSPMDMPPWYREALRAAQTETRQRSGVVRGYW